MAAEIKGYESNKRGHRKQSSIHRRRGLELNAPGMLTTDFDAGKRKHSTGDTGNHQINNMFEENVSGLDLYPGALVELKGYDSVGMVHVILGEIEVIGIELEGPNGNSDGIHEGIRRFTCPQNCAVFVEFNLIHRILPMGSPPRFQSRAHDIYPGDVVLVNKEIGVGIARYVSAHLIGIELNCASGDSDGTFNGNRFFQVTPKHAIFSNPSMVKKIHPEDLLNRLNSTVEKISEMQEQQYQLMNQNNSNAGAPTPRDPTQMN